ncbi:MAG TPA: serine/threonine-protein kinase [Myxococcales bacterium]|nr:serine/threonine-protein kinase [Myxococcales bacterium]
MRKLAVGGMAEVFLAKSGGAMGFTKTVVVKRILPHLADDQMFVQMFLREAKIAAELAHPNVVQIFDFGESEGRYYIAMEYVDGPNLRALITRSKDARAPMPLVIATRLIAYACEGLGFAHAFTDPESGQVRDIIHRDISPDNILVSRTGAVKVADFGLAKALNSNQHTQAGMLKGKIPYMAPEQIRGKGADRRADIYALGVTLFELCTGRRPFEAENDVALMSMVAMDPPPLASALREDLPQELASIIDKSLRKNPEQRYQTCREMQTDLEAYLRRLDAPSVGPFELAAYVGSIDAIPRSPTGRHFPAAAEPIATRADRERERATPSTPAGDRGTPPPRPPPTVDRGAVEQVLTTVPRASKPKPQQPQQSLPSGVSAVAGRVEELVAQIPPERRPFFYGGVAVLGVLLVVLGVAGLSGTDDPFNGPCTLEVDSTPPARIRINTREMGKTPKRIAGLPAGPVLVEVYDPDVPFSKKQLMTLSPGDNGRRPFVISTEPVELRIFPRAKVSIDGKPVGFTPLPKIPLLEGTHRLQIAYDGTSVEQELTFEVRAGSENVVKHQLVDVR